MSFENRKHSEETKRKLPFLKDLNVKVLYKEDLEKFEKIGKI